MKCYKIFGLLISFLLLSTTIFSQLENCNLPECLEGSAQAPGEITNEDTPQFIVITFDDAIQNSTENLITPFIDSLKNPDGRSVKRTYFTNTLWTEPEVLRKVYREGNEIANHTALHNTSDTSTYEEWVSKINELNRFLVNEIGMNSNQIAGFRAPMLATNNAMFKALNDMGFLYDASLPEKATLPVKISTGIDNYIWPFTLDDGSKTFCLSNLCPDEPVPGLWEIPLWVLFSEVGNELNVMDFSLESDSVFKENLEYNFNQSYNGNKSPFGIFMHAIHNSDSRQDTLRSFLKSKLALGNVWIITMRGLIEWMRNPVPNSQMAQWFADSCQYGNCRETSPITADTKLFLPEESYEFITPDLQLEWEVNVQAETYTLQLAYDSDFINIVQEESGLKKTIYNPTGLSNEFSYFWRVRAENKFETGDWSESRLFSISSTVDVDDIENSASGFHLQQNYPNPFNPTTTIKYSLPAGRQESASVGANNDSPVQLLIYNLLGQQVATLVNEQQPAGNYSVKFDASKFPSGIYYYQLKAGNFREVKKMVLTK